MRRNRPASGMESRIFTNMGEALGTPLAFLTSAAVVKGIIVSTFLSTLYHIIS
ncbi:hypothetical protein BV25DRAFT_1820252 [Artomyces pyxidatus]|uniref:Uncharacterized protein n=1 Tax=Artomyces pyxidatus TaxID=48021 RepID=A0ACB8TF68_9AGAM|nr:hypothetical protein BV25DRAFT_1820252 [Artomyces pyxidatus]